MFFSYIFTQFLIGSVKIFDSSNVIESTELYGETIYRPTYETLESKINKLNDHSCSLGQDLTYYSNLKKMIPGEYQSVLERLNDLAFMDNIVDRFLKMNGVRSSLMRFSSAEKALNEIHEYNIKTQESSRILDEISKLLAEKTESILSSIHEVSDSIQSDAASVEEVTAATEEQNATIATVNQMNHEFVEVIIELNNLIKEFKL